MSEMNKILKEVLVDFFSKDFFSCFLVILLILDGFVALLLYFQGLPIYIIVWGIIILNIVFTIICIYSNYNTEKKTIEWNKKMVVCSKCGEVYHSDLSKCPKCSDKDKTKKKEESYKPDRLDRIPDWVLYFLVLLSFILFPLSS